ncbi:hypothetical protein N7507_010412 [Penicillium longicatenatum]|nr:hypothetical protein N7507_010412 [Penicillium longicatenatum]
MHFTHALFVVCLMACLAWAHPGKEQHPAHLKERLRPRRRGRRRANARSMLAPALSLLVLFEPGTSSAVNSRPASFVRKSPDLANLARTVALRLILRNGKLSTTIKPESLMQPQYLMLKPAAFLRLLLPTVLTMSEVRSSVRMSLEEAYSQGVAMHVEIQYIDVNTCEPLPNLFVDIWNANATGVYSGILEQGNYAADGWNSTFLRGIQPSDKDGVAVFDTTFPGHYTGRATHTHLLVHSNATLLPNGTLLVNSSSITHNGQLFFNEELRSAVEATYPYNTDTIAVTSNADDQWAKLLADSEYDPFVEYAYLGDDITDGLFVWKQIGINSTADYTDNSYYAITAYIQANGGFENTGAHKFTGGQ